MTKATRVQLKLQDSGSILYKDSEDDIIFHIEAGDGSYGDGAEAATTDVMSFLRQHLLKNGASRHDVTSLMRTNRTIGPCSRPLWGCTVRSNNNKEEGPRRCLGFTRRWGCSCRCCCSGRRR